RWPKWMGLKEPPKTALRATPSVPELTVALDDELDRRQLLDADGTSRVDARGGDTHLGAHPELPAVDETGRRVDQHRRGVDLAREAARVAERVGDDGLREPGAVAADVGDGVVKAVDDPHREHEVQVFLVPIALGRGRDLGDDRLRARTPAQLHSRFGQALGCRGQEAGGGPAFSAALASRAAIIALDSMASLPPRRMTALPDLRQSPTASAVTLGRDS